jgi:hypothetical protein
MRRSSRGVRVPKRYGFETCCQGVNRPNGPRSNEIEENVDVGIEDIVIYLFYTESLSHGSFIIF